jgi:hypothetical protein
MIALIYILSLPRHHPRGQPAKPKTAIVIFIIHV